MSKADTSTSSIGYDHITAAREAGASPIYLMLASIDPDSVEIEYNHIARKLSRHLDGIEDRDRAVAEAEHMAHQSGHFMSALWDGDLAEALYRADMTNMRLIIRTLDERILMDALVADRGSEESARRWLEPNLDKYGFDGE